MSTPRYRAIRSQVTEKIRNAIVTGKLKDAETVQATFDALCLVTATLFAAKRDFGDSAEVRGRLALHIVESLDQWADREERERN